jgi:hypothetical protein
MYWTGSTIELLVKLAAAAGAFTTVIAAPQATKQAIKQSHGFRLSCTTRAVVDDLCGILIRGERARNGLGPPRGSSGMQHT